VRHRRLVRLVRRQGLELVLQLLGLARQLALQQSG
jgi:hypothetical protein